MAKMTTEERDKVLEFLEKGNEGDSVEHEGRVVEMSEGLEMDFAFDFI